jgi:hypothetical protein
MTTHVAQQHFVITAGLNGLYCPNVVELAVNWEDAKTIYIDTLEHQTEGLCDCETVGECEDCGVLLHAQQLLPTLTEPAPVAYTYRDDYDYAGLQACDCASPLDHIDPAEYDDEQMQQLCQDLGLMESRPGVWTIEVCEDCTLAHAGVAEGPEPTPAPLSRIPADVDITDGCTTCRPCGHPDCSGSRICGCGWSDSRGHGFSNGTCAGCGSTVAGNRYPLVLWAK